MKCPGSGTTPHLEEGGRVGRCAFCRQVRPFRTVAAFDDRFGPAYVLEEHEIPADAARAYLLIGFDTAHDPPRFAGLHLFSEPSPTSTGSFRVAIVAEASGPTYEEACRTLARMAQETSSLHWTIPVGGDCEDAIVRGWSR